MGMTLGQFSVFARILGLAGTRQVIAPAPSGVDDTAALQAKLNAVQGNPSKGLFLPDGVYKISAPLTIGVDDTSIVTGLRIHGESRGGVIIQQMTDGQPIFKLRGQFIHSCHFEHMTLTYTNNQAAGSNANVFQVDGPNGGSFYNTTFEDIYATKYDWFLNVGNPNPWGIAFKDHWHGAFASGVNNFTAVAGQPRCTFENLYITGDRATQPLFNHKSVTGWYNNIEVNNCVNGVKMLFDPSGGSHTIGHWALEGANFAAGTQQLFDCQNSRILAKYIYMTALTLAAGATVYAFHAEGGKSTAQIDALELGFTANAGQFYVFNSQGPLPSWIGDITGLNPGGKSTLCDIAGSAAGNFCQVKRWNDPTVVNFLGDADTTLTFDAAHTQVLDIPTTAIRKVILPVSAALATNAQFTGRSFHFSRTPNSTGGFALNIRDSTDTTTLFTMAAGSAIDITYARSGAATGFKWVQTA